MTILTASESLINVTMAETVSELSLLKPTSNRCPALADRFAGVYLAANINLLPGWVLIKLLKKFATCIDRSGRAYRTLRARNHRAARAGI